jgi:hypothetical protein
MHSSASAAAAGGLPALRPDQAGGAYGPYLTEQVRGSTLGVLQQQDKGGALAGVYFFIFIFVA